VRADRARAVLAVVLPRLVVMVLDVESLMSTSDAALMSTAAEADGVLVSAQQ